MAQTKRVPVLVFVFNVRGKGVLHELRRFQASQVGFQASQDKIGVRKIEAQKRSTSESQRQKQAFLTRSASKSLALSRRATEAPVPRADVTSQALQAR